VQDNILMKKWNISKVSHLYRKLYSLEQDELKSILNEYKEPIDWFDPETFIYFNNLNHAAAVAIATFANAKSNAHLLPDYIPHEPLSINMGKEKIDKVLSESKNPKMIVKTNDGEVPYWFTITETVDKNGKVDSKTHIFNEIKNRGVDDILIISTDNLSGISKAINSSFPNTQILLLAATSA